MLVILQLGIINRESTKKKGRIYMAEWPKGVAKPAIRALNAAGYTQLQQLKDVDLAKLKNLHGMGPKALAAIETALKESR